MKRLAPWIKHTFFNEDLDFRARVFNTLGLLGIVLGAFFAICYTFVNTGIWNVLGNLAASVLAGILIIIANKTGRFKLCFLITVVAVFIVLFPLLFFVGGGYMSGMPSFFVFAVVFTVIMLEGRRRTVFTILEVALYSGCFLTAYLRPETVVPFATDAEMAADIIVGCLMSSAALAVAIYQHIVVYDRKQRQLEQLFRERTELFGNISHEMKTPLAVISTYAQLLKNKLEQLPETSGSVNDALLIISEANQLGMTVSQALEFARTTEGRMLQGLSPCHIGEIITDAVATHFAGSASGNNNNRIDLKITGGLPPILADARRITQLVVNLVSNAVRHTSGGVVTVSAYKRGGFIYLSVADTGKGMTKDEIALIFERWHTVSGGTGTGLGLYICKRIAQAHGGEITVDSEPGKGSTFTVTLPIDKG